MHDVDKKIACIPFQIDTVRMRLSVWTITAAAIVHLAARARTARVAAAFAPTLAGFAGRAAASHPSFPRRRNSAAGGEPIPKMAILESPSAERNKGPINDVLASSVLPDLIERAVSDGRDALRVLELAAGCGVHTTHLASSFLSSERERGGLGLEWHPSDPDADARRSIDARVRRDGLEDSVVKANGWILGRRGGTACNDGGRGARDAGASGGGEEGNAAEYDAHRDSFDLALCINMIHISPWEATLGLMECAGMVLREGGMLVCYGPYKVGGTAVQSNL